MRIKPKNPKTLKLRRTILGIAAVVIVLAVFLWPSKGTAMPDESSVPIDSAATLATENVSSSGELDWEYPPGWVDFSDLPDKSTLGDEEVSGLSNWRYLLVNGLDQSNYLRDSYYPEMVYIEAGYSFRAKAADDLKAFIAAARDQGFTVSISRTYFGYADQKVRFNGLASTIYERGGCTLAEAEREVTKMGYFPGADEHQTGLAVNFVDEEGNAKFSTPVLAWMREHCAEYGFILRYPEGREEHTGREAEAGHFRYVGHLAAEYIMRKGITLEEFKAAYEEDEEEVWKW